MAEGIDASADIAALGQLFIAGGFLVGLVMFIAGLYDFYLAGKYGNDPSRSISGAFWKLTSGIMLLLSITVYQISKGTIGPTWTMTNDVLVLSSTALNGVGAEGTGFLKYLPKNTVKSLFAMVWLIGLFGFLKGIYLVRFSSEQASGAQGYSPIKKVITHIFGGVVLMNITDVSQFAGKIFGFSSITGG